MVRPDSGGAVRGEVGTTAVEITVADLRWSGGVEVVEVDRCGAEGVEGSD